MKRTEAGFSLLDVLAVSTIIMVTVGVAAPTITNAVRSSALNGTVQTVTAVVRNARYASVTKNRTFRIRFNCPGANQMRVIEVVGNPAIDDALNRCDTAAYPYPDPDPAVLPNNDGPVVRIGDAEFGTQPDIQISPAGRMTPLLGCPACATSAPPATLVVRDSHEEKRIVVAASGQVSVSSGWYARVN
jgi:type II secretory pathway pseudopilin PulG